MASIWRETFEASEFDNAWDIEGVDAGCTSDGDNAGPGSLPLAASTKCYKTITVNNTTGNDSYIFETLAGDEATVYFTGYFYVSAESLANAEFCAIYTIQDNANQLVAYLYLWQTAGGVLALSVYFYNNGALEWSAAQEIAVGNWYKIQIKYDVTGTEFQFKVNGSVVQTKTLTGILRTPRKIALGQIANPAVTGNTTYWDACEWDDSSYPEPEADVTVEPATLALALTLQTPTVFADCTVLPATLELALTQQTPTVVVDCTVTPAALALALTQHAPTVIFPIQKVLPDTFELVLTLLAPTILAGVNATVINITYLTATTGYVWYSELSGAQFNDDDVLSHGGDEITVNGTPAADPTFYETGEIEMTSGVNNGQQRPVALDSAGVITVLWPFVSAVAMGDSYNLYPGCDLRGVTCHQRFHNEDVFRGFLYVPRIEDTIM